MDGSRLESCLLPLYIHFVRPEHFWDLGNRAEKAMVGIFQYFFAIYVFF